MKISMPVKIIIGLLTAWVVLTPFIFIGAWILSIFSFAAAPNQTQQNPGLYPVLFIAIIFLIIATSLLHVGMQAFYLVHVILNKTGLDVSRILFGVGMIILPTLAMPVYYFVYILPENPPQWALAAAPSPAAGYSTNPPPAPPNP